MDICWNIGKDDENNRNLTVEQHRTKIRSSQSTYRRILFPLLLLFIILATGTEASQHPLQVELIQPTLVPLTGDLLAAGHPTDHSDTQSYLFTFHTVASPFYAVVRVRNGSQNSPIIGCESYDGQVISPDKGRLSLTLCSGQPTHIYSTIVLDNGQIYVIRSPEVTSIEDNVVISTNASSGSAANGDTLDNVHYLYRVSSKSRTDLYKQCTERFINNETASSHNRQVRDTATNIVKQDKLQNKLFNIETIIFVDQSLIRRFNGARDQLQKLILAIMNEVQLIYNFDTMKIRIRILIKKIVFLGAGTDSPDTANGDIDQYLDNFCLWQKRLWKKEAKNSRWDHALMLTGLDLYKKVGIKRNNKVLGLAWVNGMCKPSYSCTLNEGKNFESAFVIAHELAHSLGMLHDGHENNCDPDKYIMSEKTGAGKIHWSPCSNMYLENFLTKSNMKCLDKLSNNLADYFNSPLDSGSGSSLLPGQQYSLNRQCQLAMGNGYRAYTNTKAPFNNVCHELWCSSGTWATPAHPALEGSHCGVGKSCHQGLCRKTVANIAGSTAVSDSYNSYLNRHRKPVKNTENGHTTTAEQDSNDTLVRKSSNNSSSGRSSFMKKVQNILRSTIGSIWKFFSG